MAYAVLYQSMARISLRYAGGLQRKRKGWASPISMQGFSAYMVPGTIPGPWFLPVSDVYKRQPLEDLSPFLPEEEMDGNMIIPRVRE